ncbi:MAG: hypothetical protein U1E42_10850 [Rhodospirillales bacterium]
MPDGNRSGFAVLFKFGQRQHLEQLRSGRLYCNNQSYFYSIDDNNIARNDRYENMDYLVQANQIRRFWLTYKDGSEYDLQAAGPVRITLGGHHRNIFCCYAVSDITHIKCDARNFAFGDSFVMITHTQEFLDRCAAAARSAGFIPTWGPVTYFDYTTYTGDTGPHYKINDLSYQNEFRLVITPGKRTPVILDIGDATDITSKIGELAQINNLVEFAFDNES